jgi:hypothetical protein
VTKPPLPAGVTSRIWGWGRLGKKKVKQGTRLGDTANMTDLRLNLTIESSFQKERNPFRARRLVFQEWYLWKSRKIK